jgi:hypothetical protein
MAKVGFEHHGPWNSTSARKMLSARGGRAAARTHKANGWKHQKRIAQISRARRMRRTLSQRLAKLEADCVHLFGEPLLEHLLRERRKQF